MKQGRSIPSKHAFFNYAKIDSKSLAALDRKQIKQRLGVMWKEII